MAAKSATARIRAAARPVSLGPSRSSRGRGDARLRVIVVFIPGTFRTTGSRRATPDRCAARVPRLLAELLLDPQQPVVLGGPLAPRGRTRLDLTGVGRHGDVGDRRVLGLARTVAHDLRVAVAGGELDRIERLGQGPDLVRLDEDRGGDVLADPAGEP